MQVPKRSILRTLGLRISSRISLCSSTWIRDPRGNLRSWAILAPQSLPSLPRLPQGFPRCSPEAPRAKNHKSATKPSRRNRFLDKFSKKSEGQILSRVLLKRSLLEGFAQNVQKIIKNQSLLETFLTTFSLRISSIICSKGGSIRHLPSITGSDSGARWTIVNHRQPNDPPPDFKNPSNGSKRPYTHTHAANSYWRSLT